MGGAANHNLTALDSRDASAAGLHFDVGSAAENRSYLAVRGFHAHRTGDGNGIAFDGADGIARRFIGLASGKPAGTEQHCGDARKAQCARQTFLRSAFEGHFVLSPARSPSAGGPLQEGERVPPRNGYVAEEQATRPSPGWPPKGVHDSRAARLRHEHTFSPRNSKQRYLSREKYRLILYADGFRRS